jgi:precorrin-6B methylase 2
VAREAGRSGGKSVLGRLRRPRPEGAAGTDEGSETGSPQGPDGFVGSLDDGLRQFFSDPPLLHTWDKGVSWNTGGFSGHDLVWMAELCAAYTTPTVAETGAGCSTLAFLASTTGPVVTIAPDRKLRERIEEAAGRYGISTESWTYLEERSETALPRLADAETRIDVALIDGGHGWPTPFVDFCYLNRMLGHGGTLILDDLQLHTVGELARLLTHQHGWERISDAPSRKTIALRKLNDEPYLPDFGGEPYIVTRSSGQKIGYEHYGLGP